MWLCRPELGAKADFLRCFCIMLFAGLSINHPLFRWWLCYLIPLLLCSSLLALLKETVFLGTSSHRFVCPFPLIIHLGSSIVKLNYKSKLKDFTTSSSTLDLFEPPECRMSVETCAALYCCLSACINALLDLVWDEVLRYARTCVSGWGTCTPVPVYLPTSPPAYQRTNHVGQLDHNRGQSPDPATACRTLEPRPGASLINENVLHLRGTTAPRVHAASCFIAGHVNCQ